MRKPYLILDCNYLCYRAFHVMGGLAHQDEGTGVIFGFLKELLSLQERFDSENFLFCWDSKRSKRRVIFPRYKSLRRKNRRLQQNEEGKIPYWEEVMRQANKLRKDILPKLGFRNIFQQRGFEADDLIALCAQKMKGSRFGFIVTADQDLYQCISKRVSFFNPSAKTSKTFSYKGFYEKFCMHPDQWPMVKALAGCSSDSIPGVPGVGEIGAVQFMKGELIKGSKKYQAITSKEGSAITERNLKLVRLPLVGIEPIRFTQDELSEEAWEEVAKELGMGSIKDGGLRKKKKSKLSLPIKDQFFRIHFSDIDTAKPLCGIKTYGVEMTRSHEDVTCSKCQKGLVGYYN